MSGRGQDVGTIRLNRITMCLLACLTVLGFVPYVGSVARADVDAGGELRAISPVLSAPGEVKPLDSSESEDYECTAKYSDVQSGAFTWVIGNCPKGSILEAVVRGAHKESEPENYSLGGWVGGSVQGCGWIEDRTFKPKAIKSKPTTTCTEVASGKHEVAESNFMNKHNHGEGDGYYVVNKTACPEYANYRPWSSSNLEQEKIRTESAYARREPGSRYPALKWRYTTKYNSTDGTGQYVMVRDASIADGEGNWVFVPRSCLPATLPENEEERIPLEPEVATGPASGVQTPSATLNGRVNPEGVATTYYFQYGTTTNWNEHSTTPVEIGSGTSALSESASIGGLAGGTTYYFRIVATSATGTSVGGPVSFTTQPPPLVSTNAASEVEETQVVLNANIDPEGLETKYHFEYGKIPGAYEVSTAEGNAGSGTSLVPEVATISGLEPGVAYHYRVVATSSAGTSNGSVREFRTRGSLHWVFYNGGGSLEETFWNGHEWGYVPLGHGITGSPDAGINAANDQFVFYNGGSSLEESIWNGSEWGYVPLGHAISGSPAVAVNAAGEQWVFYNDGGSLEESYWNGHEWGYIPLGHGITGSPAVGIDAANEQFVFYNNGGSLEESFWNGKEWGYDPLHHGITGSPAVAVNSAGEQFVFYNNGGSLEESFWNGKEWGYDPLHHGITGSPAVAVNSAGEQFIAYNGGSSLEESFWNGKEWGYVPLHHGITGSPAIVMNPYTGELWIFYNGGSSLEESAWNGKEWEYVPLHHAITGNPTAVANTGNFGE